MPADIVAEEAARRTSEALEVAYQRIGHECVIKNLILSIDELRFSEDQDTLTSTELAQLWTAVTGAAAKSKTTTVENYGVAEFSSDKLAALYDYARKTGAPVPTIDHINANDSCALPPGLISFARQNGIKLLAHHDAEQIMPADDVAALSAALKRVTLTGWSWVLRLTYIASDRQVLTRNEYLACVNVA